ncbi:MAG: hypothetical protein PHF87_08580 [Desulfotomaculaceae bacterium]|nr:hypothetical protein [Desulfotomaculaceae bacterium]
MDRIKLACEWLWSVSSKERKYYRKRLKRWSTSLREKRWQLNI